MNASEYDYLRKFLLDSSGLSLDDQKQYLIESRLIPLVRTFLSLVKSTNCFRKGEPERQRTAKAAKWESNSGRRLNAS